VPEICEISKHSSVRGGAARPSASAALYFEGRGTGPLEPARLLQRFFQSEDPIAQFRRALEILPGRRFVHLDAQRFEPFARLPVEKRAGLLDALAIIVGRDRVRESIKLAPHVVVELPGAVGQPPRIPVSQQNAEAAPHLGQGLAQRPAVRKGAEITRAVVLAKSDQTKAGQLFGRVHPHEQEALVVREIGVVPRLPLLDQLPLEQERLGLGAHLDRVEVRDEADERADLGRQRRPARTLEIRAYTPLQAGRLAHVDDPPQAVFHQINARFVRQPAHPFLQC
jgi:hypothetical protein